MTIPNPIQQGNGVNMFVRLWRSFVLGSVCLVLLGIEMILISLQTFPLLRMQGLRFRRAEIILFCTFVGNFVFIKVNSENKYVQLTATIVTNCDHIYFLLIKRKDVEIKCQLDATEVLYCRSYCLLNMFRAPLCPSSGAQEYYTVVAACSTPDQQLENHSTKSHRQQPLYNTLELLMMGIVVPKTC